MQGQSTDKKNEANRAKIRSAVARKLAEASATLLAVARRLSEASATLLAVAGRLAEASATLLAVAEAFFAIIFCF
jgi:hypothetical protein